MYVRTSVKAINSTYGAGDDTNDNDVNVDDSAGGPTTASMHARTHAHKAPHTRLRVYSYHMDAVY